MKDEIQYLIIEGIPEKTQLKELLKMYNVIFSDADLDLFKERIKTKKQLLCLIAYDNNNAVGFKIGYKYNETTFYSWIGGVLNNYRRKGIANNLASLQENWVRTNGFSKLRTKSMNKYKPMLILNIKNGFDIVEVYTNNKKQTKIIFEKKL